MSKIVEKDVDGEKVKVEVAVEFFDYVNNILSERENIMETDMDEKAYVPFMINRALSQNMDTVLISNEMNLRPKLSKRMHYDYLRFSVRKHKRYNKWAKQGKNKDMEVVCEYYQVSKSKALDMLKLLTKEQITELSNRLDKGGTK